jgi:hypothetical protein
MDKVVHFEIPCEDKERAGKFYNETFGWELNPFPDMNYIVVHTTPIDEENNNMPKEVGSINGGLFNRGDGPVQNIVVTLNVEDIDKKLEEVKKNGGKVVKEKMEVGNMGWVAYFKDTEGNVVSLWTNKKKE